MLGVNTNSEFNKKFLKVIMNISLTSYVLYITVIGLALVSFTEQNSFKLTGNQRILQAGRRAMARIQTSRSRSSSGRIIRSLFKNIRGDAPKRAAHRAARATRKVLVKNAGSNDASNQAKQLARHVADAKARDQKDKKWKRNLKKHLATESPSVSSAIERVFYDADKYFHVGRTDQAEKIMIPL
jgi:hypothetical protein